MVIILNFVLDNMMNNSKCSSGSHFQCHKYDGRKGSAFACVLFTHIAEVNDRPIYQDSLHCFFKPLNSTQLVTNRLKAWVSQEKKLFCMDISVS